MVVVDLKDGIKLIKNIFVLSGKKDIKNGILLTMMIILKDFKIILLTN